MLNRHVSLTIADGPKAWGGRSPNVTRRFNMTQTGFAPFFLTKCVEFVTKFCRKVSLD